MPKYPPFGRLLAAYLDTAVPLDYAVYVFSGKRAISNASKMIARGQVALALPDSSTPQDYVWPVKDLALVLFSDEFREAPFLERIAFHLLQEGARQVCVFNGEGHPVEIYHI